VTRLALHPPHRRYRRTKSALAGIFVQIGLRTQHTSLAEGHRQSPRGEIEVGRPAWETSVPGVFLRGG
jgi:alkyl hydroperoxide reductase subunit AhpF